MEKEIEKIIDELNELDFDSMEEVELQQTVQYMESIFQLIESAP
jgi:hypothetical protein